MILDVLIELCVVTAGILLIGFVLLPLWLVTAQAWREYREGERL